PREPRDRALRLLDASVEHRPASAWRGASLRQAGERVTGGVVHQAAVVGAGAWGTALADLLAGNGHSGTVWASEPDVAASITRDHENRRFLAGVRLSPQVRATT